MGDRSLRRALTGAEAVAAALVAAAAAVVILSYVFDRAGTSFTPARMLVVALLAGGAAFAACAVDANWRSGDSIAFAVIVVGLLAWLVWIARPTFLPLGSGSDLTHHILLIQYVEHFWRLPYGLGIENYLGEMFYYTPGSHVLIAVAGAWARQSGFHAMHAVMATTVALKAGLVFLIARRVLPDDVPRTPIAAVGAVSLLASPALFLGAFVEFSFVAQVVSELFAVAMLWATVAWDAEPQLRVIALGGVFGGAVFLTWPIFLGPPAIALAVIVLAQSKRALRERLLQATVAALPIVVVAGFFIVGRVGMMRIAGAAGLALSPTAAIYGRAFLIVSSAGLLIAAFQRRTRALTIFTLAIGAQAAGLYWFATANANVPYMAMKMLYLFLAPQAIGVAVALGWVWRIGVRTLGSARVQPSRRATALPYGLAWAIVLAIGVFVARPLAGAPANWRLGHHQATTRPLERAGDWAREHVPAGCVEYLVPDDQTAYWLHLAVLGNPRQGARTGDSSTYEFAAAMIRWLTPGGLPYAIVDLPSIPSDVRRDLDVVAAFDSAAVAKRRGPASCPDEHARPRPW